MKLNDKVYHFLKECVLSYLPQFGVLLIALTDIWGIKLPADQVNQTILAVCAFLGVVLKIANVTYLSNTEVVDEHHVVV